jgi:hypothetical protein
MREKYKKEQGIDLPPPPPLPPGAPAWDQRCTKCKQPATVYVVEQPGAGSSNGRPSLVAQRSQRTASATMLANAPGRAVVGDPMEMGVVTADGSPAPIGMVQSRIEPPMPRKPGTRDTSVMMSSFGSEAIAPPPANRPHVISHMLGLTAIGRHRAEAREKRKTEKHASVAYGAELPKIDELPASAVYGRRGR